MLVANHLSSFFQRNSPNNGLDAIEQSAESEEIYEYLKQNYQRDFTKTSPVYDQITPPARFSSDGFGMKSRKNTSDISLYLRNFVLQDLMV